MSPRFSVYLDLLRFLAAMVVFVSHFAYPRFTDGDYILIRELNLGSDAVVFFFVLSGLVIGYTTQVKDNSLKQYSFHRMTRLYSVIAPALIITVILDMIGTTLAPQNYEGWWYNPAPIWEQLLRGLTFSNEWADQHFRIGTNGPYWSLSYEAAYYILFGIGFYLNGFKRILLLIPLILLFGLPVLLLFPIWLLGLWTYQQIKKGDLPPALIWPFILIPPALYILFLAYKLPKILLGITIMILGPEFTDQTLGFSDEFIWNILIGILVSFHLIGMAALYHQNKDKEFSKQSAKVIRWCAGATFTIYVIHYPALQCMDAILSGIPNTILRDSMLFASVLLFCLVCAEFSERRLKLLRKLFSKTAKKSKF